MLLKALSILGIGAGMGVPMASTLKGMIVNNVDSILGSADSVVKIEWMGENMKDKVGEVINGLGEIIHKGERQERSQNAAEVIGLRLTTWGTFDDDVCKNLGFPEDPEKEKQSGLGCHQGVRV
ncbi:hypothetical protein [Mycoplasma suis]|uniref:Uncharacterized protein n=1 Tax=Mycoplasma suis (strain Illinois) TaxID=768700 RepID=F0QQU7_MYCSL|nr:hypothetical protein [Mycoplasma suis]ADX97867.1 hypothetical protein MSU_0325 [Mycoplasma suis str. Illinois]